MRMLLDGMSKPQKLYVIALFLLTIMCFGNSIYGLVVLNTMDSEKSCESIVPSHTWLLAITVVECIMVFLIATCLTIILIGFQKKLNRMTYITYKIGWGLIFLNVLCTLAWAIAAVFVMIESHTCYTEQYNVWLAVVVISALLLFRNVCGGIMCLYGFTLEQQITMIN